MKLSLKALLLKSLAITTLAGAVAFVTPAKAEAQGFGVAVHFGNPYPVAYGFGDPYRHDAWRQHEAWVRQQDWLRHEEWQRANRGYGRPPFGFYR